MRASTTLPLSEMSQADKRRVMEEPWDDLFHSSEGLPSPAWRGEILAAGGNRGEASFREWASVRESLLRKKA